VRWERPGTTRQGDIRAVKITPQDGIMGATVSGFEFGRASEKDLGDLLETMYATRSSC
jgi:hypothetical protein